MNIISIRHKFLKYHVDLFNKKTLLELIKSKINSADKTIIAHMNLHAIACLLKSAPMTALFSHPETYVHIDGMPIVWLLRCKGVRAKQKNRLTYLDWGDDLLALAATENWKIAYIGSSPEICTKGVDYFKTQHPKIILRGWDGFFDMQDNKPASKMSRMIRDINGFEPDLLIVGMGMPRQEIFYHQYAESLSFKVGLCSGAFFEYYVGGQAMPSRWIGSLGLEWLYRLAHNPKRYAHRYLVEPLQIIYCLICEKFKK